MKLVHQRWLIAGLSLNDLVCGRRAAFELVPMDRVVFLTTKGALVIECSVDVGFVDP